MRREIQNPQMFETDPDLSTFPQQSTLAGPDLHVLVKAAWSPNSHPRERPNEVIPICFIRPSSILLCKGPPESPLETKQKKH
jgi:hypothetical protein